MGCAAVNPSIQRGNDDDKLSSRRSAQSCDSRRRRRAFRGLCGGSLSAPLARKNTVHTENVDRVYVSGSDEDTLSDITVSAFGKSFLDHPSENTATASGAKKFKDDIEQQRQEVPLSIEEDLFIYDDAIVSKNDARRKHWCIEGRQPRHAMNSILQNNACTHLFHFTDFNVLVDEFDADMEPEKLGNGQGLSILQSTIFNKLQDSQVTRTFSVNPNTVAAWERRHREAAHSSRVPRSLKSFDVRTLMGHAARVKCISIAKKEETFASCSCEGASVSLRHLSDGEEYGLLTGHRDTIICTAFSPDGKLIATTSKDRTMILWDATVTKLLHEFPHEKVVICCCFSPDSRLLVSGCQDYVCRVWDARLARELFAYGQHAGIVVSVAFSPDGVCCCSASADRTLRVWFPLTGKTRFRLQGHQGIILACSYTTSGAHIVSNDEINIFVWSASDGKCRQRIVVSDIARMPQASAKGPRLGWTLAVAAPGAFTNYVVAACTNRFVYIMDFQTGREVVSTFCKAPVYALACGTSNVVSFGDSFGNVYVQTLS